MLIKYRLDIDDYVAFNRFHMYQSKSQRRTKLNTGIITPIIFFLFLSLIDRSTSGLVIAGILSSAFAIYMLFVVPKHVDKKLKQMLSEGKNRNLLNEHQLEINESCICGKNTFSHMELKWDAVEKIAFTNDYTFIYTSSIGAIVVPRSAITEGNYETFKKLLKDIYNKKKSDEGLYSNSEPNGQIINLDKHFEPIDKRFGKHSEPGIISFILSLIVPIALIAALSIFFPNFSESESYGNWMVPIATYILLFAIFGMFFGIAFGISGVFQKNRKKIFAIIGLILNLTTLLIFAFLTLLGLFLSSN